MEPPGSFRSRSEGRPSAGQRCICLPPDTWRAITTRGWATETLDPAVGVFTDSSSNMEPTFRFCLQAD